MFRALYLKSVLWRLLEQEKLNIEELKYDDTDILGLKVRKIHNDYDTDW